MECRTPKTQKIFLIHIPEKYSLEGDFFVRLQLSPLDFDTISNSYIDRLQEVKQNIDGDLLFISNILVTLCKSGGDTLVPKVRRTFDTLVPKARRDLDPNIQCYSIVTGSYDDEADYGEIEPEAEKSEVEEVIVKKMARINKLVGEDEPKAVTDVIDVKSTRIGDVTGTSPTIVELEFEDVEITPLLEDDGFYAGEGDLVETYSDQAEIASTQEGGETASNLGDVEGFSSASSIGMIYYCIDLGLFYKTLQSIEQDIEDVYEALDEGGYSLIDSKLEEISNIIENIRTVSNALVEKVKREDVSLRTKKESLLTVVNQAESIKLRTAERANRYGDVLSEIEGIHLQAKELIRNINADMIRNRETTIDTLDTILASLEEIIRN